MSFEDKPIAMTGRQYRDAIERLGLNQIQAARFLGINDRTSRKWADEKHPQTPPHGVALLLALMDAHGISAEHADTLARRAFAGEAPQSDEGEP